LARPLFVDTTAETIAVVGWQGDENLAACKNCGIVEMEGALAFDGTALAER